MKYRTPIAVDGFDPRSAETPKAENSHRMTYTVKVITPIYGGGVEAGEPDTEMPIRASEIRGQLRYWWRFLQSNHKTNEKKQLTGEELFKAERRVWGGMADAKELEKALKEGKDYSSKVFLKVHAKPVLTSEITSANEVKEAYRNTGYVLFPAVQNNENHKLIKQGYEFSTEVSQKGLDDAKWQSVNEAIRWWICFGGIGARTRRGLGSVEVIKVIGDKDFTPLTAQDVNEYDCVMQQLGANNAMDAWNKAVGKLQQFRQGRNIGRDQGHGNRPGQSFWPEADSIRNITGMIGHPIKHQEVIESFPRASFGLPIIFEIRGGGEPDKTELTPVGKERLASPLILKVIALGNNQYKAIALRLPTKHIQKMDVILNNSSGANNPHLPKQFTNPESQNTGKWWEEEKAINVPPMTGRGNNALDAFMKFFTEGNNN